MSRALLGFKEDPSDHRAPALTSGRPYHAARAHSVAIGILEVERGIKHDPAILDLFVRHDAEIRSAVFRPGMHLIMDQFAKRTSCRLIQSGRMQANGRGKAAPPFVCRDQHLRARRGGTSMCRSGFANCLHIRGRLRHRHEGCDRPHKEYVCRMRRTPRCALSMRALPLSPRREATPRRGCGSRRLAQSDLVRSRRRAGHAVHRQPGKESDAAVISNYARAYPSSCPGCAARLTDDVHHVHAFGRFDARHRIAVILNDSSEARTVTVPAWWLSIPNGARVTDLLTGSVHEVGFGAHYGAILVQ